MIQKKPKESLTIQMNTGDCTPGQHRRLQDEVNEQCKNKLRGCKGTDSCSELLAKIINNSNCIRARQTINNTCYRGGDAGHQTAAQIAVNALIKCQTLYTSKCREEAPETIPEPVPIPAPVSIWDKVRNFTQEVVESGLDAEQAAEQFFRENPEIAWTIIIVGVIGIIALLADDLTIAGIADDFLIPIVGALVRVAWRYV